MEQAVAENLTQVEARARFDLATPDDEPELRRLARENAMGGTIRLSLELAPNSPLRQIAGPIVHQTIVGRRDDGSLFGSGTRSVSISFINGEPAPLGYLSGLRLDADYRSTPRTIVNGYQLFRELHEADGAAQIYLTSILSDNRVARRLLEANLRGMPTYRFVGEFATLIFRPTRRYEATIDEDIDGLVEIFNGCSRQYQFGRVWSASDFDQLTLKTDQTGVTLAMWHRQVPKQIVVRGYEPAMALIRPALNLISPLTRLPKFPPVGESLNCGFLSMSGIEPSRVDRLVPLVRALSMNEDCFVAGAAATDPRLDALRRAFGGRITRSRLYVVFWPDGRDAANALDERLCHPEVALL
jgi:hypothetical protein